IISMLRSDCDEAGVRWFRPVAVHAIERTSDWGSDGAGSGGSAPSAGSERSARVPRYLVRSEAGELRTRSVVIATGGLAIPKTGASDFGLRIARQFGLRIVEPRPALVPLSFDAAAWQGFAALAGVALPVTVKAPLTPEI